jgi:predicted TIM-barrel fold metal-dependent hydrolase
MIIDAHTRTWPGLDCLGVEVAPAVRKLSGSLPLDASPAALERATEPLAGAIIHGFRADRLGAVVPNDAIIDAVRQGNGRYVGVAGIDPTSGDAWDEFRRCTDLGLFGICVSPAMQGFLPSDERAMRLFAQCATDGFPVFVSRPAHYTRNAAIGNDRPTAWTETMRQLPRLKVVFSGMGWPWIDECIAMLTAFENARTDTSGIVSQPWALYNAMLSAVQHGVADRVLFASGWPHTNPKAAAETVYGLGSFALATPLPRIQQSVLRAIVERNAYGALGIPDPASLIRRPADARFGFLGRTPGAAR